LTHIHREEIIREITFPDAFVKKFTEEIDPHTGDGLYTLILMQKVDKRIDIEIEPYNVAHPSLSQVMEEAREQRETKKLAAAGAAAGLLSYDDPLNSPPYWVERQFLVSQTVNVLMQTQLHCSPGGALLSETNHVNLGLRTVVRARVHQSVLWFMIENPNQAGQFGWIPSTRIYPSGSAMADQTMPVIDDGMGGVHVTIVSATPNPQRMIVMASDFGSGVNDSIRDIWSGATPGSVGRRVRTAADVEGISSFVNGGGIEAVGSRRGLVDGTIVTIRNHRSPDTHLVPVPGTRISVRWIKVSLWRAGMAVATGVEPATSGRIIAIPSSVTGRITRANGNIVNVVLNTRGNTDVQGFGNATHSSRWFAFYGVARNGALRDSNTDKIRICVGPRVFAPDYPDNGRVWSVEPAHGIDLRNNPVSIDVLIRNRATGEERTLECIVTEGGVKAHTLNVYPHDLHDRDHRLFINEQVVFDGIQSGIHQTGIAYPRSWNAANESQWAEQHMDGSTVEFRTHRARFVEGVGINPSDFDLVQLFVHN